MLIYPSGLPRPHTLILSDAGDLQLAPDLVTSKSESRYSVPPIISHVHYSHIDMQQSQDILNHVSSYWLIWQYQALISLPIRAARGFLK